MGGYSRASLKTVVSVPLLPETCHLEAKKVILQFTTVTEDTIDYQVKLNSKTQNYKLQRNKTSTYYDAIYEQEVTEFCEYNDFTRMTTRHLQ